MKIKQKELYRAPESEALEIKTEGVICGSVSHQDNGSGGLQDYGWNEPALD